MHSSRSPARSLEASLALRASWLSNSFLAGLPARSVTFHAILMLFNVMKAVLIFFYPGGFYIQMLRAFGIYHLVIYALDR